MLYVFAALASEPASIVDDGTLVHEVSWARPFVLEQPHPYRYTREPREISSGWLVQLQVEAWTMVPRQVGVPNLWIGDQVAGRLQWGGSTKAGPVCAVFWVPGDVDLSKAPVFFGTTGLAERVDSTKRAAVTRAAAALPAVERLDVVGPVVELAEFGALVELGKRRCAP